MLRIGRSAAVLLPLLAALQQAAAGQGTTAGGGGGGGNATAEEHCPPPTPLPLPPGTATAAGVAFFCLGNTTAAAVVTNATNATSNNSTSNSTLQGPPLTLPQVPPPLWGAARVGAGDSAWPQGGWVMAPPTAAGAAGTDVVVVGDAGLVEATQRSEGGLHWAWRRCVANDSFAVEATVAGSFPPIPSLSPPVPPVPPPPSSSLPPSSPPPASHVVVPGLAPDARFGLMLRVGAADASAPFLALLGRPDDGAWAVFERRTRGARATRVTGWLLPEVNTTAGAVWQQPRLRMRRWDSSHAELGVSVDGGVSWVGGFSNVRFDPEGADLYWGFMVSFDVGAAGNLTQNGPLAVHFADVGVGAWCRDVPCNQGCTRSPDSWPDNPGRTTMVCECPDGGSGPQCTSAPGPAAPDYGPLIGGIVGAVLGCAAVVALVVFFARAVRRTSAAGVEKDDDGSGGDAAQPAHSLSPPGAEDKNAAADAGAAADPHHADSDYLAPPSPGTPTTGNRSLRVSFGNAADHHTALATVFTPSGDYGVVGGVDDDDEACGPKKKSAKLAEDDAAADPNNAVVVTPTTTSPPTGTEYGEMPVSGATSGGSNTTPATPGSPFRVLDEAELAELGFEDNSVASSEPSRQVSPKSRGRKMSMPPSPFAKSGAAGAAGGGGDAVAGSGAAGGGGGGSGADESEDLMGSGEYAEADLGGADTADSEYGGLPEDDKGEYGGLPEGQEGAAGGAHEYADAEVVFERRTTGPGTAGNGVAAASAKQKKKKKQDGGDEDEEDEEEVTDEYGDVDDLTPAVEDSDADASSSSSSESISTSVSSSTAASDGDDDDDDDEVPPPPPEQG